jgi:hypothetical protein
VWGVTAVIGVAAARDSLSSWFCANSIQLLVDLLQTAVIDPVMHQAVTVHVQLPQL